MQYIENMSVAEIEQYLAERQNQDTFDQDSDYKALRKMAAALYKKAGKRKFKMQVEWEFEIDCIEPDWGVSVNAMLNNENKLYEQATKEITKQFEPDFKKLREAAKPVARRYKMKLDTLLLNVLDQR